MTVRVANPNPIGELVAERIAVEEAARRRRVFGLGRPVIQPTGRSPVIRSSPSDMLAFDLPGTC